MNAFYVVLLILGIAIAGLGLRDLRPILQKRYGAVSIGSRRFKYRDLLSLPMSETVEVLVESMAEHNTTAASWTFESLVARYGHEATWRLVMQRLAERDDSSIVDSLDRLIPSHPVGERSPHDPNRCLHAVETDFRWTSLIGRAYLARAKRLVGEDKPRLTWNKTNAIKFLRKARERAPDAASLAVLMLLYESALYLMYKGAAAKRTE